MHSHTAHIDEEQLVRADPFHAPAGIHSFALASILVGVLTFIAAIVWAPAAHLWGVFYTCLVFFMGIACGQIVFGAILQIVRASWSYPIRRIAEAGAGFLPFAYAGFLITYFGKEHLFYWGTHPMPGREWWMQPDFVYLRFAILLGILFLFLRSFVKLSLRADLGFVREKAQDIDRWFNTAYDGLLAGWRGSEKEIVDLQRRLSVRAPVVIMVYAVIFSLFSFEMIMGMNKEWFSNMFGGHIFISNIFAGLAFIALTSILFAGNHALFGKVLTRDTLWDLGKLTFAFTMLWGYLFFSQFLVQWYGNLPEETQWMILRTREFPWKGLGWLTFSLCFVLPFILLLSRDLKKTPVAYGTVCLLIVIGVWLDRYVTIMPELFPSVIPFGWVEIGMFLGFLGAYLLSVWSFLGRYPFMTVSSPLVRGKTDW